MNMTLTTFVISGFIRLLRNVRIIRLESRWQQFIWTIRAILWRYPLPTRNAEWLDDFDDLLYRKRAISAWTFLRPFFSANGYILYASQRKRGAEYVLQPPLFHTAAPPAAYPYARLIPGHCPVFYVHSPRVWAARDSLGRDVVIKAVSDIFTPSNELKVLKLLNSPDLRRDPRNHTIPIIEYLTFDTLIFAVMPRWDRAFQLEFSTVLELMEITKACLETFTFLHEHRIVHCDFLDQNIGMNIITTECLDINTGGFRDPPHVSYALYDFGISQILPSDTSLDDMKGRGFLTSFSLHRLPTPEGDYNAFKADIGCVGTTLQTRVRHIENIVPELGPFFDQMTATNEKDRLSAQEAFDSFMKIYKGLTPLQLNQEVGTCLWCNGIARPKYKRK